MKVRLIDVSQHPLETLDEFASASYRCEGYSFSFLFHVILLSCLLSLET